MRNTGWVGCATAVVATLTLTGCGGGADDGTPAAAGSTSAAADPSATCEAWVDSDAAGAVLLGLGDPSLTPEQVQGIVRAFWTQQEPILDRMEQQAPDDIRPDVTTLLDRAREGSETGDPATLAAPELGTADSRIDRYALSECGYPQIRVTATDHAYEGLSSTVPAGTVAFTLDNQGEDFHQLLVSRANDGVTQSFTEILGLPLEQQVQLVTPLMATDSAPGATTTVFLRLTPGRYGALDAYPEGTVDPTVPGSGPPHAALGMVAEFTVGAAGPGNLPATGEAPVPVALPDTGTRGVSPLLLTAALALLALGVALRFRRV